MEAKCFNKQGSDPPICGVHNGRLVQGRYLVEGSSSGGERYLDYWKCPISGFVVSDNPRAKPQKLD